MLNQEQVKELRAHAFNTFGYAIVSSFGYSFPLLALLNWNIDNIVIPTIIIYVFSTLSLCAAIYSLHSLLKFFNNAKNNP